MRFACRLADAARAVTLPAWQEAGASRDKAMSGPHDPVTATDVATEQAMRALIREHYPDHGIMGEELADHAGSGSLAWSLDPIDGTRSFVCGLPTWTTLIALLWDGEPVLGLIDAPRLDERYLGCGGEARSLPDNRIMSVSSCRLVGDARLASTDPDLFEGARAGAFRRLREACRVTRYGHDGYAYARLAAGSIDLVVEADLKPHDVMALIPVVRGAGGIVGNWTGGADVAGGEVVAAATPELFAAAVALLA